MKSSSNRCLVVHFPCRTIRDLCPSGITAIHREKLPGGAFFSPSTANRNPSDRTAGNDSNSNSSNCSSATRRFHNRPIATRLSISSLGILLTVVAPLSALIRQLVVSWLLARTATSYQRDHTVLFANGEACLPAKTERMPAGWRPRVPISTDFDDLFNYFDVLVTVPPCSTLRSVGIAVKRFRLEGRSRRQIISRI